MNKFRLTRLASAIVLAAGLSSTAMANTTTSNIKGHITGPEGNAAAGTEVTIVHVPSGTSKSVTVNNAGFFSAKNLRIGGPYKVSVDSDKFEDQTIDDVFLILGETLPMTISLDAIDSGERLVITGRAVSPLSGSTGPATHFTADDLANLPAINRDIKDIVRNDPRIYIDESQSDAIQCGGGSPRYNSLTLDGVRLNDSFGLNSNGYPTTRMPFSYDAIDQVSVELAPFDVKYGGFTSCNINAVTKSGGNDVTGGVFYDYTDNDMLGDSIDGDPQSSGEFTQKRYGFNVGLPLIEDTLFFFTAYEKLEGVELFEYNPLGNNLSESDLDRIVQITRDVYGYDAGGTPASLPVEDEKLLLKLDWNINDDHRASLVYNYNDGFRLSQSDAWGMTLDSHFYESGAELESFVGSLYSDWTENFSTSIRVGTTELVNRQQSLDAASSFGEVQIRHNGTTVFLGPDDSRQSNKLYWDSQSFKLAGIYYQDEHTITMGYEFEELTAFNLFMQHTQGEFRFDSIDDYEAGLAARVYYNNSSGTNVPEDASQEFSFALHTFYIQDEYTFLDEGVTVTAGLRYDSYTSDDKPRLNANFVDRYGFGNDANMDGIDLLQPRLGINWAVDDNLEIRGGIGLYSGGNPNVWISNAYSNDGLVQVGLQHRGVDLFNTPMTNGGTPGFEVPQDMFDEIQNLPVGGGDGSVNSIDPNFEIPSEWKFALGATYNTEDGYTYTADILHNRKVNSATMLDLGLQYSGETIAADGRPLIERIDGRSGEFMLTNSDKDGKSTIVSFAAHKKFENGVDATLSYAYTNSEDANPMTSAVAGSNYSNLAVTDPINPGIATSNYGVPHQFTLSLRYKTEFIEDYATRFSLFGILNEGQPYSYTFDNSDRAFGDRNWNGNRQLLYIPLENDPNVIYAWTPGEMAAFNQFIEDESLTRGAVTERNGFNAGWSGKFDVRVSQELPVYQEGHTATAYLVIKNIGNLMNDKWGVLEQGQFVGNRMVEVDVDDQGRYIYEEFNSGNQNLEADIGASLWRINVGFRYNF